MYRIDKTEGPCLNLDLTKPPEQAKLLHLIAEGSDVCLVWLEIPCDTFRGQESARYRDP